MTTVTTSVYQLYWIPSLLMIFLVYSQIELQYVLNTPHLNDSSIKDYYFVCNVVGETLQWEVNGFSLGGFVNTEVGLVRISERSQFNYSAFLITGLPFERKYILDGVIVVTTSQAELRVTCLSDLSNNSTNTTATPSVQTMGEVVADPSGNVLLQHVFTSLIIRNANRSTTNVFMCGTKSDFLAWEVNGGLPFGFSVQEMTGRTLPSPSSDRTFVPELSFKSPSNIYTVATMLIVSGSPNVSIRCSSGLNEAGIVVTDKFEEMAYTGTDIVTSNITTTLEIVKSSSHYSIKTRPAALSTELSEFNFIPL